MFDILFGWRKASKCNRLIKKVQCRLKLLKNKRSTIARQLRDDLAELLKHGHDQSAFERVEQLYRDENLVQVYDLLENFCEFVLVNLPYMSRNKDCPNDINEAMSSLIFASARFGDLPELLAIRKLFEERYGQRFVNVALELLPGNLVNRQIQEKLSIKSVADDVKTIMLVEIARSALKSGPLLLEYNSEVQQQQQQQLGNESKVDPILNIEPSYDGNEVQNPQAPNIMETEREVVYVDFPSGNSKKFLKDLFPSFLSSKAIFPSKYSAMVKQASINTVEPLMQKKVEPAPNPILNIKPFELAFSSLETIEESTPHHGNALASKERNAAIESSSESSARLQEETIYLDDIQEFESPARKEGSIDQRLFKFKPSTLPLTGKIYDPEDQGLEEEDGSHHEKAASRSFRKSRKASGRRLRRRSVSIDITSTKDVECAIYYGELSDGSANYDQKSHDKRRHQRRVSLKRHQKSHHPQESLDHPSFVRFSSSFSFANSRDGHKRSSSRCSLEHPCYLCTYDETDAWDCSPDVPKIECKLCYHQCSCNQNCDFQEETKGVILPQKTKKNQEATKVNGPWTRQESKHAYSRAMTMPIERPNGSVSDKVLRSNSFPVQEPGRCSSNRHVHPKLPDYDELATKFKALKKANLQVEKQ